MQIFVYDFESKLQASSKRVGAPLQMWLLPTAAAACLLLRPTDTTINRRSQIFPHTVQSVQSEDLTRIILSGFALAHILTSSYAFKQPNSETEFPSIICYALKCFVLLLSRRHPQPPSTFLPGSGTGGSSRLLCIDFRLVLFLIFYFLFIFGKCFASCPRISTFACYDFIKFLSIRFLSGNLILALIGLEMRALSMHRSL